MTSENASSGAPAPEASGASPPTAGAAPPAGSGSASAAPETAPAAPVSAPAGRARRSGGGCATGFGVVLILVGGLALWWNLAGIDALFVLLSYAPLAAVWWPAVLVLWGLVKVAQRLRTGYSRFGFGEVVLLLVVLLLGLGLTAGRSLLENLGLEMRFGGVRRWIAEQSRPLPQHAFVRERVVSLPAEGPARLELVLPAGSILVDAADTPPAPEDPSAPPATGGEAEEAGGTEAAATDAGGPATADSSETVPREAVLTLGIRVRAPDAAAAAARAGEIRIVESRSDGGGGPVVRVSVEDRRETASGDPTGGGRTRDDDRLRFAEPAFDLTVAAPPGIAVTAESDRGAVRVRGAFAGVSVEAGDGPVEIAGARGEVSIVTRDGPVRARGLGGPLSVRARRASVEVEGAGGSVSVESAAAPIRISGAEGSVSVRATRGIVDIAGAGGAVRVDSRLAPVTLRGVGGGAEVRAEYGGVFAVGVTGGLDIRTDSGAVEVRGAPDGARITAGDGPVLLADAAGEIVVRSAGDADLDVRLAARRGPFGPVTLTTDGGEVWLELPETGAFSLRADLGSGDDGTGEVESDLALERAEEDDDSVWLGAHGAASETAAPVTIRTAGGDLMVRSVVRSGAPSR